MDTASACPSAPQARPVLLPVLSWAQHPVQARCLLGPCAEGRLKLGVRLQTVS